jgi:hypothetical protein
MAAAGPGASAPTRRGLPPGLGPGISQKKKSRSWALRSALPCLRKRTSSASSAQNSLQKNWPLEARHGCNSPFTIGSPLPQNAQRAAASVSIVDVLIRTAFELPMPSSRFILWRTDYLSRSAVTVAEATHVWPKYTCRWPRPREGRGEEIGAVLRQLSERRLPGARTAERAGRAVEPPGGAEGARSGAPVGAASPRDRVRARAFTIEETDNVRTAEAPME